MFLVCCVYTIRVSRFLRSIWCGVAQAEMSGKVHFQKVGDKIVGVITILAQLEDNRPVLWHWHFTSEHKGPLHHLVTVAPTNAASLFTRIPKAATKVARTFDGRA